MKGLGTTAHRRRVGRASADDNAFLYASRCTLPALAELFDEVDADTGSLVEHVGSRAPFEPSALLVCTYIAAFSRRECDDRISIPYGSVLGVGPAATREDAP